MTSLRQRISHALCLLALSVGAAWGDAPRYTVTDLGEAGQNSQAEAINNRGQIVGWEGTGSFLWDNGTRKVISAQPYQGAHGINESGQVVGIPGEIHLTRPGAFDILSGASAFVWDRGYVDYLPGFSNAYGINAKGQVAGESGQRAAIWERRHVSGALNDAPNFIWQSLPAHKIGPLPGYPYGVAYGLNDDGVVVGVLLRDLTNVPKHGRAFRYEGGRLSLLPMPPTEKTEKREVGGQSSAAAVNESGQVVGTSRSNGSPWKATLWQPGGGVQNRPTLPGYSDAGAHGINTAGQVVGGASRRDGTHACLWQGGTAYDLNTCLPADSGWTLQQAQALNDRGWIVGGGTVRGEYHAFLLRPNP